MLVKSKVEPVLPTLTEIWVGLAFYDFLNLIKDNSAIFYHIFCPSGLLTWTYGIFIKVVKPKFSENGSHKFSVDQSKYNVFLDMAEAIFTDGKCFHQIFSFQYTV